MPKTRFQSIMQAIREGSPDERSDILDGYYPYETIKFSGRLKILDSDRAVAIFTRRQRVRFLEEGMSVFFDHVWGDGVLFGSYGAPGLTILQPIRTLTGYVIPLALPRRFRKGETFEIVTRRRIVGAFYETEGYWETTMNAPADMIQISLVTPPAVGVGKPEVIGPARGDIDATNKENSLKMRVARPGLNVPYRLGWSWK